MQNCRYSLCAGFICSQASRIFASPPQNMLLWKYDAAAKIFSAEMSKSTARARHTIEWAALASTKPGKGN
jgi:hypothetical protein